MPKIIEDLENKLIEEAQRQLEESGYSAVTIRSVAQACGVGVGTVYNYFPSKDALLATYMLRDWEPCIAAINAVSAASQEPKAVIRCIYDQLMSYTRQHQALFADAAAGAAFAGAFVRYHAMLRNQLSAPLRKFCQSDFAADFVAENLLTWTRNGTDFDALYDVLDKLFSPHFQ